MDALSSTEATLAMTLIVILVMQLLAMRVQYLTGRSLDILYGQIALMERRIHEMTTLTRSEP